MRAASIARQATFQKSFLAVHRVRHKCLSLNSSLTYILPAAALGLMDFDDSTSQAAYSSLIQTCNRFLLECMSNECDTPGSNKFIQKPAPAIQGAASTAPSPLTQLVALSVRTTSSCSSCGHRSHRDNTSNVLDFVYPRQVRRSPLRAFDVPANINSDSKHLSNETPPPRDFFSIFKASIARENVTRSICPACRKTTAAKVRRQLTGAPLPTILAVNTAVHTSDHMQVWLDTPAEIGSRFLQPRIGISALGDRVVAVLDNEPLLQDGLVVYELQSIIAQIQAIDDPAHLVTLVKSKSALICNKIEAF